jgi:hypothetical protein
MGLETEERCKNYLLFGRWVPDDELEMDMIKPSFFEPIFVKLKLLLNLICVRK